MSSQAARSGSELTGGLLRQAESINSTRPRAKPAAWFSLVRPDPGSCLPYPRSCAQSSGKQLLPGKAH